MTHQHLVVVRLAMKSQQKTPILMMNVQHVNLAVHAMIAETVRLAVSNHRMNQQNQSFTLVPMVNH
jgi:hypothetical protein